MQHLKTFPAKPLHNENIGYPGELVDGWQDKAVKRLGELVDGSQALRVFLDTCVKCGACTDKCHYFLGTEDPLNMPVARQDLLRSVYRRYYTFAGKHCPKLVGAKDFDKEMLDDWYNYFHQCSQCRRCSVFCPYGIDTAEISMAAREVMDSIGVGQKYCNEILAKVHKIGNNLGLPEPALVDTLEGLEEDVEEDTGVLVRFPVDQKGADVLLITPSADFFAEPHIDGLIGYAKVFHQAGIRWTLSSHASEAANFSLFIGSGDNLKKAAMRIREAALELGVKRIIVGECGHAWRVAYSFWNTLIGPFDFLDPKYPAPQHIVEFTYDLIQRGALTLDKEANDHRRITFHDSCNVARASRMGNIPGGQFILPREVIKAAANHFFDMAPDTIHEKTFCCGGGGGLLTDDLMELRVKGAMPRMQALQQVVEENGVNTLVAICAICKTQFAKTLPHYQFQGDMITSLHEVVGDAIQLGAKE
ncbi:MAG TPA: (Fe-S)-binding protein [Gammaproteobacteria bacterium]|nr:(Fe-S)-binding protein [Gammaproteobacteria bacterium]